MMKSAIISVAFSFLFFLSIASTAAQEKQNPKPSKALPSSVQRDRVDTLDVPMRITPGDTSFEYRMPTWPSVQPYDTTFVDPKRKQEFEEKEKPERKHEEDVFVPLEDEPRIIKKVDPVYPPEAKKAGLEGTVWVKALVGIEGKVKKAEVIKADAEIFVKPALAAMRTFRFTPAMKEGKPVAVWVSVPFKFSLGE